MFAIFAGLPGENPSIANIRTKIARHMKEPSGAKQERDDLGDDPPVAIPPRTSQPGETMPPRVFFKSVPSLRGRSAPL
jgi:hypothetical protein